MCCVFCGLVVVEENVNKDEVIVHVFHRGVCMGISSVKWKGNCYFFQGVFEV